MPQKSCILKDGKAISQLCQAFEANILRCMNYRDPAEDRNEGKKVETIVTPRRSVGFIVSVFFLAEISQN